MIHPVIMAGGTGSRLWPLSRELNPKQFLTLTDERTSMLQQTVERLHGLPVAEPLLICHEEHRFLAAEQMRLSGYETPRILLEPYGRNTAPAVALAALELTRQHGDTQPLMLVLSADHLIRDAAAFRRAVNAAEPLARSGKLVTFGVVPDHPETGYGYIQKGNALPDAGWAVKRFVEKPAPEVAERYLASGDYLWNSGMFLMQAHTYLRELSHWRPDILAACESAITPAHEDLHFVRVDAESFAACPSESIDYAIMEHTQKAAVVSLDAGWSDIGSWSALWAVSQKDERNNALSGDVIAHNTDNTLVRAESRLVATLGIQDTVVIETKDAVLVAHKDHVQDVRYIVDAIRDDGRHEHMNHREVYRPWGRYDAIDHGHRYQVKHITVKPGGKLSVQKHHHRAEHWIVVSGTAMVTCGERSFLVTENQSTYIPVGEVHSLENPGVINLELIEVQSGAYLGEDDIVRLNDEYGRL